MISLESQAQNPLTGWIIYYCQVCSRRITWNSEWQAWKHIEFCQLGIHYQEGCECGHEGPLVDHDAVPGLRLYVETMEEDRAAPNLLVREK